MKIQHKHIQAVGLVASLVIILLAAGSIRGTSVVRSESDPVLVGAGDIASCDSSGDEATAALLDSIDGVVYTTGDNAYPDASPKDFRDCYEPSWGRHKARTRPATGNHEYHEEGGEPYFDYFGSAAGTAGQGYYSYNLGTWHVVVLNSGIASDASSEQAQWLRADLAEASSRCTVAYWHHPLYSSGKHGNHPHMRDMWHILYEQGVDVVLNGHDHNYERFAPQDPLGQPDTDGIRQFVVGTGGGYHQEETLTIQPNSEVRNQSTFGVLKLVLHPTSYDWEFVPIAGEKFRDNGNAECVAARTFRQPSLTTSLSPATIEAGSSAFTVTVYGNFFTKSTIVQWNREDRPTTFINSTQLLVNISSDDIASAGTANITVIDPKRNQPSSNVQEIVIRPHSTDNLLVNGGFESDTDSDGNPDNWWNNPRAKRQTTVVHSGSAAMQHYATDDSYYIVSQTVDNVAAGAPYEFSGRVNIPPTSDTYGGFSLTLHVHWRDGSKNVLSTSVVEEFTEPTNGWQQAIASFVAPEGTTNAQVQMVLSSMNANMYVDDFLFRSSAAVASSGSTEPSNNTPESIAEFFTGGEPLEEQTEVAAVLPSTNEAASAPHIGMHTPETAVAPPAATTNTHTPETAVAPPAATDELPIDELAIGGLLVLALLLQIGGLSFIVRVISNT